MMERKIDGIIRSWVLDAPKREAENIHKCLLLRGLRQTGKSYAIRKALGLPVDDLTVVVSHPSFPHFPKTTAIEINLSRNAFFATAFDSSLDAVSLVSKLAQSPYFRDEDLSISPSHRLILFIDEIQISAKAVEALKFLSFQKGLLVIASGSMLGLSLSGASIFPTGYVDNYRLYPMDFEEFLWAMGYSHPFVDSFVKELAVFRPLLPSLHEELLSRYREYVVCGGLPEFVSCVQSNGIHSPALYLAQRSLCLDYESDIGKYAEQGEQLSAKRIFSAIPTALAREKTRFVYSLMGKGASRSRYQKGLDWLVGAGLVYQVPNLEEVQAPLAGKALENDFKLYLADPGILWGLIGEESEGKILDPTTPFQRGMIFENSTADILASLSAPQEKVVYYYGRENSFEIDFAIEQRGNPLLLEAKSSLNTRSRSLNQALLDFPSVKGIRVSPKQIAKEGNLYSLPHYALPFLNRILF